MPYSKLRDVFEREGRGVFLPYEQFQRLWESARGDQEDPVDEAPVDAILTEVNSLATVRDDVVWVDANLSIELLNHVGSKRFDFEKKFSFLDL